MGLGAESDCSFLQDVLNARSLVRIEGYDPFSQTPSINSDEHFGSEPSLKTGNNVIFVTMFLWDSIQHCSVHCK